MRVGEERAGFVAGDTKQQFIAKQLATRDLFGWQDLVIRGDCLDRNQIHHRNFRTRVRLVLARYNIDASDIPWQGRADNLASPETA